jgi:pyruvate-formate lyase-activating enzyme
MKDLYILKMPNVWKYDAMLREQGYLDYVLYLRKHSINAVIIDLKEKEGLRVLKKIPRGANVVISVTRTPQIKYGYAIAKYLKAHKKAVIIFGKLINYGAFATPYFNCSEDRSIDHVIPQQCGEMAVLKYLQGDAAFLINNSKEQERPDKNAAEIKISDLKVSDEPHHQPFLTYEISRGCPHRCYYCASSLTRFQCKKVSQVISEIRKLIRINKTRKLVFVGPEINFDHDYLIELMEKLVPLKMEWTSYAVPKGLSKRTLSRMKKAGCRLLSLGLESADQNTLNSLGKKTRLGEVSEILQDCYSLGIRTQINVLVGFPHERHEDIEKLKKFILLNKNYITNINLFSFNVPKDSAIGKKPANWGIVLDRSHEGEFYPFYEKGRSSSQKNAEIITRIGELNRFIAGLKISRFNNISTSFNRISPFDESFEKLYLNTLDLGKVCRSSSRKVF